MEYQAESSPASTAGMYLTDNSQVEETSPNIPDSSRIDDLAATNSVEPTTKVQNGANENAKQVSNTTDLAIETATAAPKLAGAISAYPNTKWTAYFYNNTKLTGGYKYKKEITAGKDNLLVSQNYSNGSPSKVISKDGFSAKIQGIFTIEPGTYILRLQHDDGAKILVDGKVVLSNWTKGGTREDAVKLTISNKNSSSTGNQHVIQIQYVDFSGGSFFKFLMEPFEDAQKTSDWIGEVYNTTNFTGDAFIVGGNNARTKVTALNFNWAGKTPSHLITGSKYSTRWYSYQYLKKGSYNILTKANDSVDVYFNNTRILNETAATNASYTKGNFTVPADGSYLIRVDHVEKDGKKNGKLEVQLPFIQLTTNEIAYNWGAGSPSASVPADYFTANITSDVTISNGDYFIPSISLGAVTTSFGQKENVIVATGTGTQLKTGVLLNQTAGTYPLNVSYNADTGNAGIFTQVVPFDRWNAFIYPSTSTYNLPKAQTTVAEDTTNTLSYQLGNKAPTAGVSANNYAVCFTNYKHLEAGEYNVQAATKAGGFSVYIDGKKVLGAGSYKQTTSSSDTARITIANDTNPVAQGDVHEIMVIFQKRTGTTDFTFDIEKFVETPVVPEKPTVPDTPTTPDPIPGTPVIPETPVTPETPEIPAVKENGYQTLDLRKPAPSSFTTTVMDNYLKSQTRYASSPFIGQTQIFLDAQKKYGVNALFLFSLAVHEGVAATSDIGKAKNNSFGLGAYDKCPFDCAQYFPTLKDSIAYQAYILKKNYLTVGGLYANGPYLGDKSGGLNVRYASDPLWGQKTANIMQKIMTYSASYYKGASPVIANGANPGNDYVYKYPIGIKGVVTTNSLNVRKTPDTNYTAVGTLDRKDVVEVIGRHNANYFQIKFDGSTRYVSQNPNAPYMKLLNLGRIAPSNGAAYVKLWKNLDPNSEEYFETIKRTAYVELILDSKNKPVIDKNTLGTWYQVKSGKGNIGWVKSTDLVQVFAANSTDLP